MPIHILAGALNRQKQTPKINLPFVNHCYINVSGQNLHLILVTKKKMLTLLKQTQRRLRGGDQDRKIFGPTSALIMS